MVRSREPLCCRCACRGSTRVVGSTAVRSKNRNTKPPGQGGKQLQARTQFSTLRSLLSAEKISLDCPTPNAINFSRASRKISIAAPNYGCTSTVPYGTLMTYTPPRSIGVAAGLHLDRDVMVCLSVTTGAVIAFNRKFHIPQHLFQFSCCMLLDQSLLQCTTICRAAWKQVCTVQRIREIDEPS